MERNSVVVVRKTYTVKETGEVITRNVEGDYEISDQDMKTIRKKMQKQQSKTFSNTDKKKYLIGKRNPKTQHIN